MKLQLVKRKLFEGMEIECYEDTSRENGDFFMTRKQIGEALEYENINSFHKVIQRNKDVIGNPVVDFLSSTDGKTYETEIYSFNQLFQILRFSKQPKANLFMDWSSITLQELITGRAELKFAKQEDEEVYKEKISELTGKIDNMTDKIDTMEQTMGTLINSAVINSYQAKQLNKLVRERVSTMLGGAHSAHYKKNSRMYFKNLWLGLCDTFHVSEYRDLNPLDYNNAIRYVANWSMV